ncbi:MAG TPA: hypothetical protein DCQ37_18855 [Desulfobacteraceae bacterium]|nr:hypothetical protein [Desulfobacteraceae bacterium]
MQFQHQFSPLSDRVYHIFRIFTTPAVSLKKLLSYKTTICLCRELRDFHSFEVAINLLIDISKQNEGWMKSLS